jgi:hypothetical protein
LHGKNKYNCFVLHVDTFILSLPNWLGFGEAFDPSQVFICAIIITLLKIQGMQAYGSKANNTG